MNSTITYNLFREFYKLLIENKSRLYISIGTGESTWDQAPPIPTPDIGNLFREVCRKKIQSIDFYDKDTNSVSNEPTDTLLIKSKIYTSEDYEGSIRECGLFIEDNNQYNLLVYIVFDKVDITPQSHLVKEFLLELS